MNAALAMLNLLATEDPRRMWQRASALHRDRRAVMVDRREAFRLLRQCCEVDVVALLNLLDRRQLLSLLQRLCPLADQLSAPNPPNGDLRLALWMWSARYEASSETWIGTTLQPKPLVVADRLILHRPPRGVYPPSQILPRLVSGPVQSKHDPDHPETIEQLLSAADRLIGVRLGPRGVDKGAWGQRAAQLLGVPDTGADEPDWRGEVEIKTLAVRQDNRGYWRIAEDPAICMANSRPMAKLQRVLWLVRATLPDIDDATVVTWYFVQADAEVTRWAHRDLHQRPKGPRGTDQRGWYLHRRFFADIGLLATLNGSSCTVEML
jgi:hypothetical protein